LPNAMFTFQEYLEDFASPKTKELGLKVIQEHINNVRTEQQKKVKDNLDAIHQGQRDIYF
ncbi:MAG: [FeFe] hydrogenase H-cluster radical SAM maturase HydG, partial [Bacteroidales bacterium]|nr:[FeFe] hydrogenase H-cluster radical SAM maturase HydG [Bacteroidales bacterium]